MTKNEGRFPIIWEPMIGLQIELTEEDVKACFGLQRIILREMADNEQLYPILGADQVLDPTTWAARRMAYYKGIEKPFMLNQAAGDELMNLLASIKNANLIGFSENDHSVVIWPTQGDIIQTSSFYT